MNRIWLLLLLLLASAHCRDYTADYGQETTIEIHETGTYSFQIKRSLYSLVTNAFEDSFISINESLELEGPDDFEPYRYYEFGRTGPIADARLTFAVPEPWLEAREGELEVVMRENRWEALNHSYVGRSDIARFIRVELSTLPEEADFGVGVRREKGAEPEFTLSVNGTQQEPAELGGGLGTVALLVGLLATMAVAHSILEAHGVYDTF